MHYERNDECAKTPGKKKDSWSVFPFQTVIAMVLSRERTSKPVGSSGNDDLKLLDFPWGET